MLYIAPVSAAGEGVKKVRVSTEFLRGVVLGRAPFHVPLRPGDDATLDRKNAASGCGLGMLGEQKNVTDDDGADELEAVAVGPVSVTLFPKGLFAGGSKYGILMFEHVVEDASPYRAPSFEVIANRLTGDQQPGELGYMLKEADPSANDLDRPLVVGVVRPGGPAEAADLKVGATIVAVDGHDVRGDETPGTTHSPKWPLARW